MSDNHRNALAGLVAFITGARYTRAAFTLHDPDPAVFPDGAWLLTIDGKPEAWFTTFHMLQPQGDEGVISTYHQGARIRMLRAGEAQIEKLPAYGAILVALEHEVYRAAEEEFGRIGRAPILQRNAGRIVGAGVTHD